MNAHFLKETLAQLFLFFSGVFLLENTVRLTKKSNGSIFWGADPIFRAVTAHAQISKKILLKWLAMNNHMYWHLYWPHVLTKIGVLKSELRTKFRTGF